MYSILLVIKFDIIDNYTNFTIIIIIINTVIILII